jgi:hypothetical protein
MYGYRRCPFVISGAGAVPVYLQLQEVSLYSLTAGAICVISGEGAISE